MALLNRKNTQTTVSVHMSLQAELLHYAQLLGRSPSALVNDLMEEAFAAIRDDKPGRPLVLLDLIRQALGKDACRRLSEEYYRALLDPETPETERAADYARGNASRAIPMLKTAKQQQRSYEEVRPILFGCLQAAITEEVGAVYELPLMVRAAAEVYDPATTRAQDFFAVMEYTAELHNRLYQIFLKDHLARVVVRDIPPHFLPPR